MARDWEWHGVGITDLPLTVGPGTTNIAAASGPADNAWLDVVGGGVSVVDGGTRPPRMQFAKAASASSGIRRPTHTARTIGQETFYFRPPATPTVAGGHIYTVRNGSGLCFRVGFVSVGNGAGNPNVVSFRLLDTNSSQIGATNGAGVAFGGGPVRVEVDWACGTTTTGSIMMRTYSGDTTTQLGADVSSNACSINTAYTQEIFGTDSATGTEAYTIWMDDFMRGTARTDGGPYAPASAPPTVEVSVSDTTTGRGAGNVVQLVGGATTEVGTISSTSWKATPGHTVTEAAFGTAATTGNTRDIALPYSRTAVTYSFTYTATNSSAQTTTAVLTVAALPWTGRWIYPVGPGGVGFGTPVPVISTVLAVATKPVLTLSTAGLGDTAVTLPWSLALNSYTTAGRVTGVQWFKRRKSDGTEAFTGTQAGTLDTAGTTRSGTINATRLTNGVVYTITVTPVIDGVPDDSLAKTVDVTPNAGVVAGTRNRRMGLYTNHSETEVFANLTDNTLREMLSGYIQVGLPETDPNRDTSPVTTANPAFTPGVGPAARDPGNPYTTAGAHPTTAMGITAANGSRRIGTYYRDLRAVPTNPFVGFPGVAEVTGTNGIITRGQGVIFTYAIWFSSAIKWVGLATNSSGAFVPNVPDPTITGNPVVTQAQWDWATNWQDIWINKFRDDLTLKASSGYDAWAAITHEPEVGANRVPKSAPNFGSPTAAFPTNHPDAPKWFGVWFTRFFRECRTKGVRSALWVGGGRSDAYLNTLLTNITVAPDLVTGDPYVNEAAATTADANFAVFTDQFRTTTGRYYDNWLRLSRLAHGGQAAVAAATPGNPNPMPLACSEQAMSHHNHTDAQLAAYIAGTQTTTAKSIREAMVSEDLEFAIWWSSGSGPNGSHDLLYKYTAADSAAGDIPAGKAIGDYKLTLARTAFATELKRTVTG